METLIRLSEVKGRVGLSRSAIYARIQAGTFPKPVSIGPRSVGFVASEIESWIQSRIGERRKAVA